MALDEISKRAMRFAETFAFEDPEIVRQSPARSALVERYGTPQSTEYREFHIHMDWTPGHRDVFKNTLPEEHTDAERLMNNGVDLLVVCSAQDVIHHEFLGFDVD